MSAKNKIAMMQPYLFPYLGYFQLIQEVDYFGIYDDVQFIRRGWINRNRILMNNDLSLFSFSIQKDSHKSNIMDRYFHSSFDFEKEKFLRILYMHYRFAPYYAQTMDLIKIIFRNNEMNVSKFIEYQLKIICEYLNINTIFLNSYLWKIDGGTDNQERLVKKLNKLNDTGNFNIKKVVNPIGGIEMYDKKYFKKHKYELNFLKSKEISYNQHNDKFIPNLSIIDVLMFNDIDQVKYLLKSYSLV